MQRSGGGLYKYQSKFGVGGLFTVIIGIAHPCYSLPHSQEGRYFVSNQHHGALSGNQQPGDKKTMYSYHTVEQQV